MLCWVHDGDPPGLGVLELRGWSPPAPGCVPAPGPAACSAASRTPTARPRADPQGPVPKSSLPSVSLWEWILATERSLQGDPWSSLSQSSEPEQIPWPCQIARIGIQEGLPSRCSISNPEYGRQVAVEGHGGSRVPAIPPNDLAEAAHWKARLLSWQGQILAREETQ